MDTLSKKTKYGLKAALFLARKFDEGPVLISDIAKEEEIPKKFLELILLELKNKSVLQSRKGRGGGYSLSRVPSRVSVGEVIRALGGPLAPVACVSQTAYRPCEDCRDERACGVRLVMKEVRDAIAGILDKTTLAEVVERIDSIEKLGRGVLSYDI